MTGSETPAADPLAGGPAGTPSIRVLTGGRTGSLFSPAGDVFLIGRHGEADLRLHPELDLSVSARHARITRQGHYWLIEDLDSRNGTWVNGTRIAGPVQLHHGDRIVLGEGGPELRFDRTGGRAGPTTDRIRAVVRRERQRFLLVAAALGVLVLALGAAALRELSAGSRWQRERQSLQQTIDSLISTGRQSSESLEGEVAGLQDALGESEQRLQRLRAELAQPRVRDSGQEEELRRELLATSSALRRQQLAAQLDFPLIQRRVRGAVAMVWVEYQDGERTTGTAFAVRRTGLLLTNRHLLQGADGHSRPRRIAVRFSDSDQAFPAHAVAIAEGLDLAALQVENVLGDVPVVPGFNSRLDTIPAGTPLALIGFPLGGEPERDAGASRQVARPVVSAALLLDRDAAGSVEVQGLGAAGGSGSPILDGTGQVIAVLFGGRQSGGPQVLLGVPARAAASFLADIPE